MDVTIINITETITCSSEHPSLTGADAEVFLPHSSKNNYRLTARTIQGTQ